MFALTTRLTKLDKKASVLTTVQGIVGNINQTRTNAKLSDPNKRYVEIINNIEYWRVNESKDKITRDGQGWYCWPNHNMEGKFDVMYMNHTANKHDEWSE